MPHPVGVVSRRGGGMQDHEYLSSTKTAAPLKDLILQQCSENPLESIEAQLTAKKEVHKRNRERTRATAATLRATVDISTQQAIDLAQEKGASSWLTALPLIIWIHSPQESFQRCHCHPVCLATTECSCNLCLWCQFLPRACPLLLERWLPYHKTQ